MAEVLFFVFATVAVGAAIGVVAARSPVGSLIFMVGSLASIAGIYVLLEAHFLAAIQVIVYAGAIMVLFLFVIMLLNLGHDYQRDIKSGAWSMVALVLSGTLGGILVRQFRGVETSSIYEHFGAAEAIDAALLEHGAVGVIAQPLFLDYVVPFELTGILLLVAIVGALMLAKRRV